MGRKKDPKTTVRKLQRIAAGAVKEPEDDLLVVERPLEIRIAGDPVTVVMRTPGNDTELAAGFLYSEGVICLSEQIVKMEHGEDPSKPEEENVVDVTLADGVNYNRDRLRRWFPQTSSCGISGKAAVEHISRECAPLSDGFRVKLRTLFTLEGRMRGQKPPPVGVAGLWAAALFDAAGSPLILREDVARHNAVDKVVGAMLLKGQLPLKEHILMVNGRATFEILQKALVASIPVVCTLSAPSSLAVELAATSGMTLVGFLRGEEMNVYTGANRILG